MIYLSAEKISKSFRISSHKVEVLKSVSLTVEQGEWVALLGSSGSGKTTLLDIMGTISHPDSGSLQVGGVDVLALSSRETVTFRRHKIGFVFQSFNLIDELNVYENIELPLLYMGVSASERKRRVEEAMNRMSIVHRAKHFPQQLSGGQQQRVAIARAVVTNPRLILADEPTGNLDSKNGKEVMALLTELNKEGTTIVMVTHSQHDAGYADRIINLFDGQVVTEITM